MEAMMKWEGSSTLERPIHIHGDRDRIFPVTKIREYIRIDGGGHFMIVIRADEISGVINKTLGNDAKTSEKSIKQFFELAEKGDLGCRFVDGKAKSP